MAEPELTVDALIHDLSTAITSYGVYPATHPIATSALESLGLNVERCFDARQTESVTLLVIDGELLVDAVPWHRSGLQRTGLMRSLLDAGVERLSLSRGVTRDELDALVNGFCGRGELETTAHVVIGKIAVIEDSHGDDTAGANSGLEQRVDGVAGALGGFRRDALSGYSALERAVWRLIDATVREHKTFLMLSSATTSEDRQWRHAINVCLYSLHLARALGLEGAALRDLAIGALLHDIGYTLLPPELAKRDRALDAREQALLRRHPELGAAHLAGIPDVPPLAVLIAYEHHLNWDGKGGYPLGRREPGLASLITATADNWDVLWTLGARYAPQQRYEFARQRLIERGGTVLDPFLVDSLLVLLPDPGEGAGPT